MMTAAVVWLVVWFALMVVVPTLVILASVGIAAVVSGDDNDTFIAAIVGWILGLVFAAFALIQVILQIISIVHLISIGA